MPTRMQEGGAEEEEVDKDEDEDGDGDGRRAEDRSERVTVSWEKKAATASGWLR
jgi:hypothetical protein